MPFNPSVTAKQGTRKPLMTKHWKVLSWKDTCHSKGRMLHITTFKASSLHLAIAVDEHLPQPPRHHCPYRHVLSFQTIIQNHRIINWSPKALFNRKIAELEQNCVFFDVRLYLHCSLQIQGSLLLTHFVFMVYVTEIVSNMNYGLKWGSFIISRMFQDLNL